MRLCDDCPAHLSLHDEPPSQLTEQLLVQVTSHVAPAPHETLPLLPTLRVQLAFSHEKLALSPAVTLQVLPFLQSPLHDLLQVASHLPLLRHDSEQLLPPSQALTCEALKVQSNPAEQVQLLPVQGQPGPGQAEAVCALPHPCSNPANAKAKMTKNPHRMAELLWRHCADGLEPADPANWT